MKKFISPDTSPELPLAENPGELDRPLIRAKEDLRKGIKPKPKTFHDGNEELDVIANKKKPQPDFDEIMETLREETKEEEKDGENK